VAESQHPEVPLRAILGAVFDVPVLLLDRNGRVVEALGPLPSQQGAAPATVLGTPASAWILPEAHAPLIAALERLFTTGEPQVVEQRLDRPNGPSWFEIRLYPLRGETAELEQAVCIKRDVTERRGIEAALRASERFAERLAEVSPVGIYRLSLDARATWMNDRLREISGATREEAMSEGWRAKLATPGDPALARVSRAMERGEPFAEEFAFARPDGSLVWVLSQGAPDRDESGRLVAYVGTLTDVTALKCAEQEIARHRDHLGELVAERTAELERAHARLSESERLASVGTFAAGIAHQINNPVGGILLAAQFAQERPGDPEALAMALEHIVADARRCGRIVRGVLEFARGDDGERHLCDLNQIASAVVSEAAPEVAEHDAAVVLELAPGLPKILASGAALDQVVYNLIENALEAGARRVVIRTGHEPDAVSLEVSDDGRGIPPDDLSRVVDPFFTTRRGRGGTGLGLSLAYGIVRGHGGSLELASRVGRGTTVTVRLPSRG
jgi:PAS domain S-box-containing protein